MACWSVAGLRLVPAVGAVAPRQPLQAEDRHERTKAMNEFDFEPVHAEELAIGDIVRRTKRAQTRLVTGIRDKSGRLEVIFEDSRFPYSLTSDRHAQWWRKK